MTSISPISIEPLMRACGLICVAAGTRTISTRVVYAAIKALYPFASDKLEHGGRMMCASRDLIAENKADIAILSRMMHSELVSATAEATADAEHPDRRRRIASTAVIFVFGARKFYNGPATDPDRCVWDPQIAQVRIIMAALSIATVARRITVKGADITAAAMIMYPAIMQDRARFDDGLPLDCAPKQMITRAEFRNLIHGPRRDIGRNNRRFDGSRATSSAWESFKLVVSHFPVRERVVSNGGGIHLP